MCSGPSIGDRWGSSSCRAKSGEKLLFCLFDLLSACNDFFSAYWRVFPVLNLQVRLRSAQKVSQLNGFFSFACVNRVMNEKDYGAAEIGILFVANFFDLAIGCGDNLSLSTVHTLYWDIVYHPLYTKFERAMQRVGEVVTSTFESWQYFQRTSLRVGSF